VALTLPLNNFQKKKKKKKKKKKNFRKKEKIKKKKGEKKGCLRQTKKQTVKSLRRPTTWGFLIKTANLFSSKAKADVLSVQPM
jgi:hypothetical protein